MSSGREPAERDRWAAPSLQRRVGPGERGVGECQAAVRGAGPRRRERYRKRAQGRDRNRKLAGRGDRASASHRATDGLLHGEWHCCPRPCPCFRHTPAGTGEGDLHRDDSTTGTAGRVEASPSTGLLTGDEHRDGPAVVAQQASRGSGHLSETSIDRPVVVRSDDQLGGGAWRWSSWTAVDQPVHTSVVTVRRLVAERWR